MSWVDKSCLAFTDPLEDPFRTQRLTVPADQAFDALACVYCERQALPAMAPPGVSGSAQMLATLGYRPLGIQAAQLLALSQWLAALARNPAVDLESSGIRSQIVSLTASALNPKAFSAVTSTRGCAL